MDLLRQGTDIRVVQVLLDHEDLSTTALYAKISTSSTAIDLLGKFETEVYLAL